MVDRMVRFYQLSLPPLSAMSNIWGSGKGDPEKRKRERPIDGVCSGSRCRMAYRRHDTPALVHAGEDVIAPILTRSRLQRQRGSTMILGTFSIGDLLGFRIIHLIGLNDHMIRA